MSIERDSPLCELLGLGGYLELEQGPKAREKLLGEYFEGFHEEFLDMRRPWFKFLVFDRQSVTDLVYKECVTKMDGKQQKSNIWIDVL